MASAHTAGSLHNGDGVGGKSHDEVPRPLRISLTERNEMISKTVSNGSGGRGDSGGEPPQLRASSRVTALGTEGWELIVAAGGPSSLPLDSVASSPAGRDAAAQRRLEKPPPPSPPLLTPRGCDIFEIAAVTFAVFHLQRREIVYSVREENKRKSMWVSVGVRKSVRFNDAAQCLARFFAEGRKWIKKREV